MAIEFGHVRYISRSKSGNAILSAAYIGRGKLIDDRTGRIFDFRHRGPVAFNDVLLPAGADRKFENPSLLWNLVEITERRKDSQVAKEVVIALPKPGEISHDHRIEMVRSFAEKHFAAKGLAVQVSIHGPSPKEPDGENWHAHILATTRYMTENGLGAKATGLQPEIKRGYLGRPFVPEGEGWSALWRDHQNNYFAEHGIDISVDPPAIKSSRLGGASLVRFDKGKVEVHRKTLRSQNTEASRDPAQVLAALVRNNATFTERDVDRFLQKHLADKPIDREPVKRAVLALAIPLHEPGTGTPAGRYTAASVRDMEQRVLREADGVVKTRHHTIRPTRSDRINGLYPDQLKAYQYAAEPRSLTLLTGRAGTGKSFSLNAIREALSDSGYQVRGLGPTNQVAEQLRAQGFNGARTVHAELFVLTNRRIQWTGRTAVVIDEAAMLSTPIMAEVMAHANKAGARVILAGDDRQFSAVAAPGGMFRELAERFGSVEVTKVVRQRVDWQRQASEDLSEGRYGDALQAYQDHHAIHWTAKQEYAKASLVTHWAADSLAAPNDRRFVLTYTNADVNELNGALRKARIDRGEIAAGTEFISKHGKAEYSVGDRVQFTGTLRSAEISNGNVGTIIEIRDGRLYAELDGSGRRVDWKPIEFDGFRHGYAGTIYKGQGRTLDRAYVLHTWHMSAQASYVALTRHTKEVSLYVSRAVAPDMAALTRQMARVEEKGSSLQWTTADEVAPVRSEIAAVLEQSKPQEQVVDKPKGRSAIAQAVEAYRVTSRPQSDLEVWAREIARGNLDFEETLEAMVSVDLERDKSGASFSEIEARLGHKLMDAINKFERLEAGVEPAAKRDWGTPTVRPSVEPLLEASRKFAQQQASVPARDLDRDVAD